MRDKELEVKKTAGTENPADLMTKHLNEVKCMNCCDLLSAEFRSGRSSLGLQVQHGESKGKARAV